MKSIFRSLKNFNYCIWAGGAFVSNIGTWMQRTAQDWLVLTQLTHNNATAVGIVMSLQFGPQLLLLPLAGYAADHLNRRYLLIATQTAMGLLALGLGLLSVTGLVELWHVYVFAFLLGCVSAVDAPARQTFVSELVADDDLANAVALNSTSFHIARMIGPAIAGLLISAIGTGWAFLINAASFIAVLYSLSILHSSELHLKNKTAKVHDSFTAGLQYVWQRPDLKTTLIMLFLIATFGLNFPIFISTMAVTTFQVDAHEYGFLTSIMAAGSVAGALVSAQRAQPKISLLITAAVIFGVGCLLAGIAPSYAFFAIALFVTGISAQTFMTSTNSVIQLSTDVHMRGRVIAILLAVALGGTPLGAPIVGWVADTLGPRWALGIGAMSGGFAALVGIYYLRHGRSNRKTHA